MPLRMAPFLLCVIAQFSVVVPGQAVEEGKPESQKAEVAAEARRFVPRCTFAAGEADAVKLDLHPDPILRWSNPTVGDVFGEVYIWTNHGQPAVVASYYRFFSPDWGSSLEISSCTEREASATVDGNRFWQTKQPGMTRKLLKGVDSPGKSPASRLVQMRRIAADFAVHLDDTRTKGTGVRRNLRLLSQPVFRNPVPTEQSSYIDGALFTFVEGTDPEVLLVLEAAEVDGSPAWRFGLARMNRDALRVTFRDTEVWAVPHIEDVLNQSKEPYSVFPVGRRP